jgi:hypothetical protein
MAGEEVDSPNSPARRFQIQEGRFMGTKVRRRARGRVAMMLSRPERRLMAYGFTIARIGCRRRGSRLSDGAVAALADPHRRAPRISRQGTPDRLRLRIGTAVDVQRSPTIALRSRSVIPGGMPPGHRPHKRLTPLGEYQATRTPCAAGSRRPKRPNGHRNNPPRPA